MVSPRLSDLWSSDVDGVVLWSKFLTYTDALGETVAAPLLELLFADKLGPGELVPAFLTGYADSLLREAMNERPLLARFSQIPHEQKIAHLPPVIVMQSRKTANAS